MKFTKHHRKPKSLGGTGEPRNVVWLPNKKHEAFHLLFSNKTPQEIADEMTRFYLDPDFVMVAMRRE